MPSSPRVLAVDLGKSCCRATLVTGDGAIAREGVGAPGLAAADGVSLALDAILPIISDLDGSFTTISVGAAGAWAAPEAASVLATRLAGETAARAVVTSDVVSAHAGALAGAGGVLLIAGTGAAALGVDDAGVRLVDGWGPEIGDFGSGSWLGREALRAVLRAEAGLGAGTALGAAVDPIVPSASVQAWLAQDGALARRLATLAPLVLDAAESGDAVAREIVTEGIRLLTASAIRASSSTQDVALHGGLTEHAWFRAALGASLRDEGREVVTALGDALDGARLLAERPDLPHERFVHRAE